MMTEKLYQGDERNLMKIFGSMVREQLNVVIDKISVSFFSYKLLCLTQTQFPQTFLTNPSKLRIYLCKIPTVIRETLTV